jgi:hypothetical protein
MITCNAKGYRFNNPVDCNREFTCGVSESAPEAVFQGNAYIL